METVSTKSRALAAILAGFFGVLGIHRFYAGRVRSGLVMLVLSLTYFGLLITSVWALIDFIVILCGTFKDKEGYEINNW